jgi:hypothetical protein
MALKEKEVHKHPVGTEASRCPRCGQGILYYVDCVEGRNLVLECTLCTQRYYRECGCELSELNPDNELFHKVRGLKEM